MTKRARAWAGITLLIVIALNYAIIGMPILRRAASIQDRSKMILMAQVKSGFRNAADDYILEILKKEKVSLDKKIGILNSAAVTVSILVLSWIAFGLIKHDSKDRDRR